MATIKKTSLYYKEGSSDKVYHIQLEEVQGGHVVNFQYGRRGGTLQTGTKTLVPVSLSTAEQVYSKLFKEKTGKGYAEGEVKSTFSGRVEARREVASEIDAEEMAEARAEARLEKTVSVQLLNEVDDAQRFIDDDNYLGQEKKDGERRPIEHDGIKVVGFNKKGKQVELPDLIAVSLNDVCCLDGEIIGDKLYVFDMLSFEGKSIKNLPCSERLRLLNELNFGNGIEVVKTAYTRKEKQEMYEDLKAKNKEGMVFKLKNSPYVAGRPNSGGSQFKFKFHKTATFIVANATNGKRSVGLELIEGNERVFMGKVTIPPNKAVPNVGDLVEVRYLYAYKGGAIFQSVYLGKRNDSDLTDATMKQIIYKAEEAV